MCPRIKVALHIYVKQKPQFIHRYLWIGSICNNFKDSSGAVCHFFVLIFYLWMLLCHFKRYTSCCWSQTKPVQPPQKPFTIPAGAHCNAVPPAYPRGGACCGVRRSWQKWTRVNVTLKTSSNQQVNSSGLPRIWWNRKQYFLWASTILANHSEEGGNTMLCFWSSLNTERLKKKSRHYANPSNGGGPGR